MLTEQQRRELDWEKKPMGLMPAIGATCGIRRSIDAGLYEPTSAGQNH
ncbi:phosphoribosyl-AMP cyclohydrolase / phosphoribosyl-ATP pyrophosphohydrolase [Salmonella enterica subsp. enterica]|uniref:Phosphoribosyl-AMP cyclohydrolase / phosphoribosyl-ATP pyrophosphohydrolase n=1 Tax=Salmonella enterica I TaxID=59201 RepID=A0A3S4K9K6_SALET|nr:phosphoribosyl-AMP cyclohydrolase / phosphoribosyl-ATP pyrophosphohydrolase [Salmonella enterica subsp. enterica]